MEQAFKCAGAYKCYHRCDELRITVRCDGKRKQAQSLAKFMWRTVRTRRLTWKGTAGGCRAAERLGETDESWVSICELAGRKRASWTRRGHGEGGYDAGQSDKSMATRVSVRNFFLFQIQIFCSLERWVRRGEKNSMVKHVAVPDVVYLYMDMSLLRGHAKWWMNCLAVSELQGYMGPMSM